MGLLGRLDAGYKRKRVDRKDSTVFGWRTWSDVGRQDKEQVWELEAGNLKFQFDHIRF